MHTLYKLVTSYKLLWSFLDKKIDRYEKKCLFKLPFKLNCLIETQFGIYRIVDYIIREEAFICKVLYVKRNDATIALNELVPFTGDEWNQKFKTYTLNINNCSSISRHLLMRLTEDHAHK
jgi:hypothetical protein